MSDKDSGFRVEDFMGVNAQISSEDLRAEFFRRTQNLHERKIGELQRRGGSELLSGTTLPSNIATFDGQTILNDRILGKTRIAKVSCTSAGVTQLTDADVTMSFVTDVANGKWGTSGVGITNAFIGCTAIQLIAYGFGVFRKLNAEYTTSLPVSGDTKALQIVIAGGGLADSNIVGIAVLAKALRLYNSAGSGPVSEWIHIGCIDVQTNPTGTFTFNHGPITLGADPVPPEEVGNPSTSDTVSTLAGTTGGSLSVGKTYYVAVMAQWLDFQGYAGGADQAMQYATKTLKSYTIKPGENAINVSKTSGGSAATMIMVGLHPHCLVPIGIVSNASSFTYKITALPKNHAGAAYVVNTAANADDYYYRFPAISREEMFVKIDGSGNYVPIFINNWYDFNGGGYDNLTFDPEPWATSARLGPSSEDGTKYNFTQYAHRTQDMIYSVGEANKVEQLSTLPNGNTGFPIQQNIIQTDGYAANRMWYDTGTIATWTGIRGSYIIAFKERLAMAGGDEQSFSRIYFSHPFNPYSWGVPGALTTAQYVQVESGGEGINGLGIYANTAITTGPTSQFIVSKPNSLHLLTDLPTYTSSSNNNTVMTTLSKKVGAANHWCIANTDIGTLMASRENVWLIRESGEPVPLGEEISNFLKPENPSTVVDTQFWNACYHDKCFKLAYSISGASAPSRELWLNIAKMKQLQGQPCWEGPHLGREVCFAVTEEAFLDTIQPKRIAIDRTNDRWYRADKEDGVQDFSTDIACELETMDHPMGKPNTNTIHTMTYWKLKVDSNFSFNETTTVLNDQGEVAETNSRSVTKLASHTGGTYATFLNTRAKNYPFYPGRSMRGETVRKLWSYTGQAFFAISGFTLFGSSERRRITS